MPYGECKIYSDGSHFIAIPHTTNPYRRRPKKQEEEITVIAESKESTENSVPAENADALVPLAEPEQVVEETEPQTDDSEPKTARTMTRKELFEELYKKHLTDKKYVRKKAILTAMRPYFTTDDAAENYVTVNLERKQRNLISRRIRMSRKANLQEFNYFVTFTYDGKLHTEESFKRGLKRTLANFCHRKGWKYMGVWERSPEKNRLHFHGLFCIPDGTMPSGFDDREDYSFATHKRQKIHENTYFAYQYGRNDFEPIEDRNRLGDAMAYLMKYIEKTGEKIVYSKDLPQFFISDVMDEDIVCPIGLEDKKLLLFDNFQCWDEGCLIGEVSKDVIAQLRKCN